MKNITYEVTEFKRDGSKKIWCTTKDRLAAIDELRWLNERKEQHDSSMGDLRIVHR